MKKIILFMVASLLSFPLFASAQETKATSAQEKLENLEKQFDGKIGIYAINTGNHEVIAYRSEETFPFQSTVKLIAVSALLKKSSHEKNLMNEKIHYTKKDLMFWHPVTGQHVGKGMTLDALSEAAISYSDNTAMNLIMKKLGGPAAVTEFAHSIGNTQFNIQHYEGDLNSNPQSKQDTSTPKEMAMNTQKLVLGNVLTQAQRVKLMTWMRNNTVGNKRIRAGVPLGWAVADKTGSGDYGIANDIGIVWSPACQPIVLAIYTVKTDKDAKNREDIVASATSIIMDEFAKQDKCFQALA